MRYDFLIATFLAVSLPSLCLADPDAVLERVSGRVQVSPHGEERFENARAQTALVRGDKVKTLKDSAAHVVFADGAVLLVKEDSAFELSGGSGTASVVFSTGEFLAGLTRPGSAFEIKTPGTAAFLGGGLLWGRCDAPNGAGFEAFGDSVTISAQGATIVLAPGQSLYLPPAGPLQGPQPGQISPDTLGSFTLDGSLAGLGDLVARTQAPLPAPAPEVAAAAPEETRLPRVRIELHPLFRFIETYDDNIYLVARDKPGPDTVGGGVVGAWISDLGLGMNYAAPLSPKHKIQGTADLGARLYSKQSKANDAYDTSEDISYLYTGRSAAAKLSNAYQNTELPAFSELVVRKRHWQDATKLTLDLAQDRHFVYQLDAQHTIVKYVDRTLGGLLNHYDQLFGGRVGIKVAPKATAFLAYHRGITHYSAGRNAGSKSHHVDAGVEGEIAERLKGLVQTGYQYRRYDAAAALPGVARLWRTSVELKYEASRSLKLNLLGFRNFSESTFGTNRHYVSSGASLAAAYTLRKLILGLNGSAETDRYPEPATVGGRTAARRDDLYGAGVSVDYAFGKWVKAGVSFTRLDRFSTFSRQFDYSDDRTSLSVRAEF